MKRQSLINITKAICLVYDNRQIALIFWEKHKLIKTYREQQKNMMNNMLLIVCIGLNPEAKIFE